MSSSHKYNLIRLGIVFSFVAFCLLVLVKHAPNSTDAGVVFSYLGVIVTVVSFLTASYFIYAAVNAYSEVRGLSQIINTLQEKNDSLKSLVEAEEENLFEVRNQMILQCNFSLDLIASLKVALSGRDELSFDEEVEELSNNVERLKHRMIAISAADFNEMRPSILSLIGIGHFDDRQFTLNMLRKFSDNPEARALETTFVRGL